MFIVLGYECPMILRPHCDGTYGTQSHRWGSALRGVPVSLGGQARRR